MGDAAVVDAAERLTRAVEASVRLHLLDAMQEAAMELSAQLPSGRVEVRLAGRDVELAYTGEEPPAPPAEEDTTARITLRLPERLKSDAEAAAAREGVSLNAWLVRAVAAAAGRRPAGNRLRGFAAG